MIYDNDVDLTDPELLTEIEALAELIAATNLRQGHLTAGEIDHALGVRQELRLPLSPCAAP